MSPPASQKIEEDVAKGLSVLQQLTIDPNFGPQDGQMVGAPNTGMPLNEVHFCQESALRSLEQFPVQRHPVEEA